MIGYATIGSNDLEKAKSFYDAVLVPLGGPSFEWYLPSNGFPSRRWTWAGLGVRVRTPDGCPR